MRKIYACEFVSLDGVAVHPQTWHFPYVDQQLTEAVTAQYAAAGAMLLGRRTYEGFAASWGFRDRGEPLSATINDLPKYVVSSTMYAADWPNSTLLTGDVGKAVRQLKEEPGGDILVPGSLRLVRSLLRLGLLDELHLMIHPIVLGAGERLLTDGTGRHPMRLTASTVFGTGVHHAVYTTA